MNRKTIKRIPTGSNNLDNLLLGGIETYAITKFYGSGGVGKSQICYTLSAITAQTDKVIYIDTEGKFRPERLVTIAQTRGFDTNSTNWLSNILYVDAMTANHQEVILKNSILHLLEYKQSNISLLIRFAN